MHKLLIFSLVLLSGCSLVQDELESVKELNKQYALVVGLEHKLQALDAREVRLVAQIAEIEQTIADTKLSKKEVQQELEIERQKLQELVK